MRPPAPFELRVSLAGMDPADCLLVGLPPDYANATIGRLLDLVFPADPQQRRDVESMLDTRANPDLQDIYAVILDAVAQWRKGLCALAVSTDGGTALDLAGPVCADLRIEHLRIEQQYSALDYAVRRGFWHSKEGLLAWLRELTVLYFLDKFQCEIPAAAPGATGLERKGLVEFREEEWAETGAVTITEGGREFIGALLLETEDYIDAYDHFKDADFDGDFDGEAGEVCFGRGRGVDLRPQVYEYEGLDPVRTVFLLRLYDGSLDAFSGEWTGLIDDDVFFDRLLEPAVNRFDLDDGLIARIVESGYSHLEERNDQSRQLAAERRVLRQVWSNSPQS